MTTMSHEEASMKIGDVMCLCKASARKFLSGDGSRRNFRQILKTKNYQIQSIAPKIIACMQAEASKVLELCAREATMIFGGNALMIGGVGDKIECSVAQVKA